jgi:hypothetical protein
MSTRLALALGIALLGGAAPAVRAHEVVHDVDPTGAVAVRVRFSDGPPLAYAEYELFSPADPERPHQRGHADRNGVIAFSPDAAGRWRLRAFDRGGHGLDTHVDIARGDLRAIAAPPPSGAASLLRPAGALLALAGGFAALAVYRRSRRARRQP